MNKTLEQYGTLSSPSDIIEVHLTDQMMSGFGESFPPLLLAKNPLHKVSIHPVEPSSPNHSSIHHGNSINFLLREIRFSSSHVILTDSDCFPINNSWLEKLQNLLQTNDAVCALENDSKSLTHPCFMVLPVDVLQKLDFLRFTREYWIDTGRLIGIQLIELGFKVRFLEPKKVFSWFSDSRFYLDKTLVHVGSASFRLIKHSNDRSIGLFSDAKFAIARYIVEKRMSILVYSCAFRILLFFPIWILYYALGLTTNISFRIANRFSQIFD
jgi:hypothetical protein